MNIVPPDAFCEALFAPQSMAFRDGEIVYTEDAGGSSPSSPTIFSNDLGDNCEFTGRFIEPVNRKCYRTKADRKGRANAPPVLTAASLFGGIAMADTSPITTALFWSKVRIPDSQADCWEWQHTLNDNGYGRMSRFGKWIPAHRFAYEALNGPIPDGLVIRHMCHNRRCCNPNHLLVGTAKDNAQDAIDAGRFTRGAVNGNAKLTAEAIAYIRQNPDKMKGVMLAEKFGVSKATISGIKNGRVWRHVAA